jgi:hypothetical protein
VLTEHGFKIAPSTYYAARTRPPSLRAVRDQRGADRDPSNPARASPGNRCAAPVGKHARVRASPSIMAADRAGRRRDRLPGRRGIVDDDDQSPPSWSSVRTCGRGWRWTSGCAVRQSELPGLRAPSAPGPRADAGAARDGAGRRAGVRACGHGWAGLRRRSWTRSPGGPGRSDDDPRRCVTAPASEGCQ